MTLPPGPRRVAAVLALVAAPLVGLALWAEPVADGDGGEYLLLAESLRRHGTPALRPDDLRAVREAAGPRGLWRQEPSTLGSYFEGADGRRYAWHFWGYSALALPARLALDAVGGHPLRALPVTNALCLAGATAVALLVPAWPFGLRALLAASALLSPALPFLRWAHPEAAVFSLVLVALVLHAGHPALAVLAVALASSQAPPLVVLVAALALRSAAAAGFARRRCLAMLAAASPALLAPGFFLLLFGTPSLTARNAGMGLAQVSPRRALDLLLDPNLGLLPHSPGLVVLALALPAVALTRRRWREAGPQLLAAAAAAALLCSANENWNNGTTGPSRYVLWLMPVPMVAAFAWAAAGSRLLRIALLVSVAVQAAVVLARGGPLAPADSLEHSAAARFVLDRWPGLYDPTPEVFVERTRGTELPVPPPHVYRSGGRCRKAYLRVRNAEAVEAQCGEIPAGQRRALLPRPRDEDARQAWVYVHW